MRHTPAHICLVFQALLMLLGCASGQHHAYHTLQLTLASAGSGSLALLVVDERASVSNQQTPPSWLGEVRSSASAKEPINTASGEPLALDVALVVSRALTRSGYAVQTLRASPGVSPDARLEQLRASNAEQLVLITLEEWHVETFKSTQLSHALSLDVFNAAGALKARARLAGTDQLKLSHDDSESALEAAGQAALEQKLNRLFSQPKIQQAFQRRL